MKNYVRKKRVQDSSFHLTTEGQNKHVMPLIIKYSYKRCTYGIINSEQQIRYLSYFPFHTNITPTHTFFRITVHSKSTGLLVIPDDIKCNKLQVDENKSLGQRIYSETEYCFKHS